MSLGSRIVSRSRGSPRILVEAPRAPLPFLYPQWARTAVTSTGSSIKRTNQQPQVETKARSNGGIQQVSAAHKHTPSGNEATRSFEQRTPSKEVGDDPVRQIARKIQAKRQKKAAMSEIESNKRRLYQKRKAMEKEAEFLPDWRSILDKMDTYTQQRTSKWHTNALRLKVPREALNELLFGLDNTIWDIKERTGCHIELSRVERDDPEAGELLLSGPVTGIAKAAAEIAHIHPKAISHIQSVSQYSTGFSTKGRRWLAESDTNLRKQHSKIIYERSQNRTLLRRPIAVDKIPRPTSWTRHSFGLYVQKVTSTQVSSHLSRHFYGPETKGSSTHIQAVTRILHEVFCDPAAKDSISTTALNDAILFFVKSNQVRNVRELFTRMERQKVRMNTETFNIMLRAAARFQDLFNFHFILSLMIRRGCRPDPRTWIAFIHAVQNPEVKRIILKAMEQKKLLHEWIVKKEVYAEFVGIETEACLDREMSHLDFLKHMDDRYGMDWLSPSSANIIIKALGARGLISRCRNFLDTMAEREIEPEANAINTIIGSCRPQHNMRGAISILRHVSTSLRIHLDSITYDTLFRLACDQKLYNVALVVWRYACLEALTTHRMRNIVRRGLLASVLDADAIKDLKTLKLFRATIGPFVAGTSLSKLNITKANDELVAQVSIVDSLSKRIPIEVESKTQDLKRVRKLYDHNLNIFKYFLPERPFADMLLEALELDEAWRAEWHELRDLEKAAIAQINPTESASHELNSKISHVKSEIEEISKRREALLHREPFHVPLRLRSLCSKGRLWEMDFSWS